MSAVQAPTRSVTFTAKQGAPASMHLLHEAGAQLLQLRWDTMDPDSLKES